MHQNEARVASATTNTVVAFIQNGKKEILIKYYAFNSRHFYIITTFLRVECKWTNREKKKTKRIINFYWKYFELTAAKCDISIDFFFS